MDRPVVLFARWTYSLALLGVVAFAAGCFPSPDIAKIKCKGPTSCPSNYTCTIRPGEPYGKCEARASTDGGGDSDVKSNDASRWADGLVALDGTSDRASAETSASDGPVDAPARPEDVRPDLVLAELMPMDLPPTTDLQVFDLQQAFDLQQVSDLQQVFDLPGADLPRDLQVVDTHVIDPQVPDTAISTPDTPIGECSAALDCPGACQTCSATRACVPLTNQVDPTGRCTGTCDAAGACKLTQGQACQSSDKCAAGLSCSPDGYCCDKACTGPCESCETGVCRPVTGTPHTGHGTCAGSSADCSGTCTGAADGQCSWGTSACGPTSCTTTTNPQSEPTGTTFVPRGTCSAGACTPGTATSCPGSLVCASATACKTSCTGDGDCLVGNACVGGVCGGKKGVGAACSGNNQCLNGNCVDGFCCESSCSGTCVACSRAKTGMADGYCRDVTAGTDPDDECAADASNTCGRDGYCGTGGACRFRPASLSCGSESCTGTTHTPAGHCDGAGSCLSGTPEQCPNHMPCAPSGSYCATSCTANSTDGCPKGYKCSSSGASCILATVPCGGVACPVANDGGHCCITGPTGGPYTQTCKGPGSTCEGDSALFCHSKTDCPSGQVCCGKRTGCWVGYARCVPPTDSSCFDGGMSSGQPFCDVGTSPAECPDGTSCSTGEFGSCGPNDIYVCR